MHKPYKTPVVKASPNVRIPEPRVSQFVIFLLRLLGRLYLFLFYGVAKIGLRGETMLFEAFERALAGKSRCIIAFRHPNGGEPQLLAWFFLFKLRKLARKSGIRLSRWPHAIFVYGFDVARWGGRVARFVMPNIGALPIHHSKMDRHGMARIYEAIFDGVYPLALAPEGRVSYTADSVPRLEPGTVRIGFHAAERLAKKMPDCPVEVLPLSVHFRFGSWGRLTTEGLLRRIEKFCGLTRRRGAGLSFLERVRYCRDHILAANEARYGISGDPSLSFEERIDKIIDAALDAAERVMGVKKGGGDYFSRLHRARQFCWDRIFLPERENFDGVTPLERSVMDLNAGEAWYISRHQELADLCWYFRLPLPTTETAFHNKIEYVQNLWDFANRAMGGAYSDRISIFPRKMIIHAAPVINLTERLPAYKTDRRAAIDAAMADLKKAYLDSIAEASDGEKQGF